jgi:hypothetical protein
VRLRADGSKRPRAAVASTTAALSRTFPRWCVGWWSGWEFVYVALCAASLHRQNVGRGGCDAPASTVSHRSRAASSSELDLPRQ